MSFPYSSIIDSIVSVYFGTASRRYHRRYGTKSADGMVPLRRRSQLGNQHVFIRGSIADKELVEKVFTEYQPAVVVNLAAQAGVRNSIDHPDVYMTFNVIDYFSILEACLIHPAEYVVYVSSGSVYGGNKKSHSVQMIW